VVKITVAGFEKNLFSKPGGCGKSFPQFAQKEMNMAIDVEKENSKAGGLPQSVEPASDCDIFVSLLTGGGDHPYAFGLATQLISKGARLDLIGSDDLDCSDFQGKPNVSFLNLRGDQSPEASLPSKISRLLLFYAKLIYYAATSKPKIFHILWNNKFQTFDRTLLTLYYRLLGKRIVLTAHNVNASKRDSNDTLFNRLTLRFQYGLAAHIFVHSQKMKSELIEEFGVREFRVTVIPFGINNAVPNTSLTSEEAKKRLGLRSSEKTVLFFGNIAPYKGLEYLVRAIKQLAAGRDDYRLIIAGRPKGPQNYWDEIQKEIRDDVRTGRVLLKADYIRDEDIEVYFKAADVFALPYRHIYQSGVLFLGYSFGLPALAADVGPLKDEIVDGCTGFVFRPGDPVDIARSIETYFSSDLYANLGRKRQEIRQYAIEKNSWGLAGQATMDVYERLLSKAVLRGRDRWEDSL